MTSNEFNEIRQYLIEHLKGSRFEDCVYFSKETARDIVLAKDIQMPLNITVDCPNGSVYFSNFICNENLTYSQGINPTQEANYRLATLYNVGSFDKVQIKVYISRSNETACLADFNNYGTIAQDAKCNPTKLLSMFVKIKDFTITDPLNAFDDITNNVISAAKTTNNIYNNKPITALQIIGDASALGWGIEKNTWLEIVKCGNLTDKMAVSDIRTELNRILMLPKPSVALRRWMGSSILPNLFPCFKELKDLKVQNITPMINEWEATLEMIDNLEPNLLERLAALCSNLGKRKASRIIGGKLVSVQFEGQSIAEAAKIISKLGYETQILTGVSMILSSISLMSSCNKSFMPTKRTLRAFIKNLKDYAPNGFNVAQQYAIAHEINKTKGPQLARQLFNEAMNDANVPITERDIMQRFNLQESPIIGSLIEAVRKEMPNNPKMTIDEAFAIVSAKLKLVV